MEAIVQALVHTPWWVYLLFGFIFYKGVRSLKTRVVSLKKLIIVPLVVSIISLDTLFTQIAFTPFNFFLLFFSFFAGVLLGYRITIASSIEVDRDHLLYRVPGGYLTLLLIVGVFATKYYIGYEEAIDPDLLTQDSFETFVIIASSLFAGIFAGKLLGYFYHYQKAKDSSTSLS